MGIHDFTKDLLGDPIGTAQKARAKKRAAAVAAALEAPSPPTAEPPVQVTPEPPPQLYLAHEMNWLPFAFIGLASISLTIALALSAQVPVFNIDSSNFPLPVYILLNTLAVSVGMGWCLVEAFATYYGSQRFTRKPRTPIPCRYRATAFAARVWRYCIALGFIFFGFYVMSYAYVPALKVLKQINEYRVKNKPFEEPKKETPKYRAPKPKPPVDEPGVADDIARWLNGLGKTAPKDGRDPSTRN